MFDTTDAIIVNDFTNLDDLSTAEKIRVCISDPRPSMQTLVLLFSKSKKRIYLDFGRELLDVEYIAVLFSIPGPPEVILKHYTVNSYSPDELEIIENTIRRNDRLELVHFGFYQRLTPFTSRMSGVYTWDAWKRKVRVPGARKMYPKVLVLCRVLCVDIVHLVLQYL